MRNTPLNGPDGSSREGDDSPDTAAERDGLRGLVGRLRDALHRLGTACRRRLGPGDHARDGGGDEQPDEPSGRARSFEQTIQTVDRTRDRDRNRPVLADHGEDRPVPAAADDGPRDRPELVARWHDDRLTLSEPDEAGAQISSDTWAEVDP